MTGSFRWLLLLAGGIALTACSDIISSSVLSSPRPARDLDLVLPKLDAAGSASTAQATVAEVPADEVPPEFIQSPIISSFKTTASFLNQELQGVADMEYLASHVKQSITLKLMYGQSMVADITQSRSDGSLFPWNRSFTTGTSLPVSKNCGHMGAGYGQHEAWNETLAPVGMWRSVSREENSQEFAYQSDCPVEPPAPPAGGGGGGLPPQEREAEEEPKFYDCYYSYLYDPDTGKVTDVFNVFCFPA